MTHPSTTCQSCGMPIESGPYCQYCTDDEGHLHPFEERLTRMSQFLRREKPGISDADAQRQALAYMAEMPAWRDHPELKARLESN